MMKKIFFVLTFFTASFCLQAQVKTPLPSPHCSTTQMVGLTEVTVDYYRPSAKGRIVFGDLVPFGKLWRTGANKNTTISFSDDVIINGTIIKSGKYAIYTVPKAESWELVLYNDSDNWGLPEKFDENKVSLRTNIDSKMTNYFVESFTISVNNLTNDNATLDFSWEKTVASMRFEVPTQKNAMASIDKVLAGPSANDYFSSGNYLFQSNGDLNKALEYINKAVSMAKSVEDVPYWQLRTKSLIQAKLGKYKDAVESAKLSLVNAQKANSDEYIKMNNESIKEWSKK